MAFRITSKIAVAACVGVLAASLTPLGANAAPGNGPSGDRGLGKHDRELLVKAQANGDRSATLIVVAAAGSSAKVQSAVEALGGTVRYREDDLGYLRVVIPLDKAKSVAAISGVQAVDVDETIVLDDPKPEPGGQQAPTPQTPPGPTTPAVNPYLPTGDMGAPQFVAAHPTWDGRGTTIGIIDSGVDLAHPALKTTTTGERKITDWVTATDPTFTGGLNNDDDATWLDMSAQVSGPTFTKDGSTYTASSSGTFRFALFNERDARLGGEVGNDVNRDGNPDGSSGLFGVLWDTVTNKVYVDTDQDRSFADQIGMTDYKVSQQVGQFGTDKPATEVAESMPFVVQTDGKNKAVNIGIVSGAHGSHVAGITAANGMFGGTMNGAAPGAKLVSVRVCMFITGCTSHALIEGMIYAAKNANVDVINMSIGGLPALNDGNNARAVLYDKLIETYSVQMFISAGNSGAGINTIGDPSVASKVMSVGSYIANATWASNYGSNVTQIDNMHPFSSRGPREDGGFKPQIVAPGSAISTVPTWQLGGPVGGTYALPAGYAMFNGTSMASPQAAGAAALLVSAAKQSGVQMQPAQLRQAMNSSARFLTGYGAYEQGNGLVRVDAAWNLLKTNAKTVDISSSVEVNTALSGFLAMPGRGQGIYDREGVKVGVSYNRAYTFTRTSGGGGTKSYAVTWVGNDGTFSSATSIALPLNAPVTFNVTVSPAAAGVHSAILNLNDPSNPGIEAQTLNTVVAADQFTAGNNYTVTKSGTIDRNQSTSIFVAVPAKTPALKVDMVAGGAAGLGQVRFLRFHPYGVGIDSNSTPNYYNPSAGGSGPALSRTVANPFPGVWEIAVEARRTSDVKTAPYTITASILGATVSPSPDIIPSAAIGVPASRSYTLTNLFGAFTGRAVGTGLGSALRDVKSIGNGVQKEFPVVVSAGSTSLRATIGGTSDPGADLDLYVYKGTTLVGQSADGDSEESVTLTGAGVEAGGTYTVVIDGYSVPTGSTTYNYVDVFANPMFGAVSVTDANALRPAGASWTVPGTVTASAVPATGRVLLGNVQVRTDTNVLIGSGDVVVQAVTGP